MKLDVAFDRFPAARDEFCPGAAVFVRERGGKTVVTTANPATQTVVQTSYAGGATDCRVALHALGLDALDGEWEPEIGVGGELYVGAVAYVSRETSPGLWIDASFEPVNSSRVLKKMFEEMVRTGEVGDITFETFESAARPNVIVVTPAELRAFALENASGPGSIEETPTLPFEPEPEPNA